LLRLTSFLPSLTRPRALALLYAQAFQLERAAYRQNLR
jgi:hypothetical protein